MFDNETALKDEIDRLLLQHEKAKNVLLTALEHTVTEVERLNRLNAELIAALKDSPKVSDTPKQLREKHHRNMAIIRRVKEKHDS